MIERFYCADCRREVELDRHGYCSTCASDAVAPKERGALDDVPYQPLHAEEIALIEETLGRPVSENEALLFIRQGRVMGAFEDWTRVRGAA